MLKGRTALVTGSTSGIGEGIARAFARAGCNIVLNGFGEPGTIEALRAELAGLSGAAAVHLHADMSRPAEIREMVAEAEARFGAIEILVSNAGIQHTAPVEEFPDERWDAIIAINLSAAFHAMKAALPAMRRRGWGRIVNIASAHGLVASGRKAAYVAAKHGLVGLTKTVAIETANSGITCNAICPGWVYTGLVDKQVRARAETAGTPLDEAKVDLLREKQPMLQFTRPEQIGETAMFLASDAASTITGAALSIDGGWTAQ